VVSLLYPRRRKIENLWPKVSYECLAAAKKEEGA
jgi:hypothetical protein